MEKVTIEAFTVNGITTRTTNAAEMNPATAKIGNLWQTYMGGLAQKGQQPTVVYGVYSNFESDENGEYDISVAQKDAAGLEGEHSLTIPAGTYLKFEKQGECPAACLELWQEIWAYFATPEAPKRTFICDYEDYYGLDAVAIYIAIEA